MGYRMSTNTVQEARDRVLAMAKMYYQETMDSFVRIYGMESEGLVNEMYDARASPTANGKIHEAFGMTFAEAYDELKVWEGLYRAAALERWPARMMVLAGPGSEQVMMIRRRGHFYSPEK
jgi:hypothetical protein